MPLGSAEPPLGTVWPMNPVISFPVVKLVWVIGLSTAPGHGGTGCNWYPTPRSTLQASKVFGGASS